MSDTRTEQDSLGPIEVPVDALWGAQTQRAIENFPISGQRFPRFFLQALGLVKKAAATVNGSLGRLDSDIVQALQQAADEVISGQHDEQFPIDIYQTGSGTSTNMNANEVIARRATEIKGGEAIHPNDHVNKGQSSNDVIPTALRISAALALHQQLMPALDALQSAFQRLSDEGKEVVTTGRTHLMDATPIGMGQRFSGYVRQIERVKQALENRLEAICELPQGGTAVGTGINTPAEFGQQFAAAVSAETGLSFREAANHFEAQATLGPVVSLHAELKTLATDLIKIANDLRWMNSGPANGLGEIRLPAIQPGSSIMPGKVNPVIEEAVIMAAMRVIGNDATVTMAGQSGVFELNVAFPVTAHSLLESIELLAKASQIWVDKSLSGIVFRAEDIAERVGRNPILATALNPLIGYDKAAQVVKKAQAEHRSVREVAQELCPDVDAAEIEAALDPLKMI